MRPAHTWRSVRIGVLLLLGLVAGAEAGQREPPPQLWQVLVTEVERAGVPTWTEELAAQITVESAWQPQARSPYAVGLTQFTPATWQAVAPTTDPPCAGVAPTEPACAIRAQIVYMRRLLARYRTAATVDDRWAFAWAAYNGGPGWIAREQRRCRQRPTCDPARWWRHVERHCLRASWACRENRAYPGRILARIPAMPAAP